MTVAVRGTFVTVIPDRHDRGRPRRLVIGRAPILEIRGIVATRPARDIRLAFLSVYVLGFGIWVAYGVALGNHVIIVPNVVSLVVGAGVLAVANRSRAMRRVCSET